MNALVDLDNEPGDVAGLKRQLQESITNPEKPKAPKKVDDSIPEKYRGKSLEDIIEMHRNAESELGRRGNELGQYKQLTDQLLQLKRSDDLVKGGAKPDDDDEEELPKISSSDLLDDPTGAVARITESALERRERKREKQRQEEELKKQYDQFVEKHPDAAEVTRSPEFAQWVQSSKSRQLLASAAAAGNFVVGATLLDEYKEARSTSVEDDPQDDPKPKRGNPTLEAARRASTLQAGASNDNDTKPSGKVYRRIDLIRLKLEDPEAYADPGFQNEIMRAYAEGRVK